MARLLVEPFRMRDGQPTGCTGATMDSDGSVYSADRRGLMHVEREDHVKQMLDCPMVTEQKFGGHGVKQGAICSKCDFRGFKFQLSSPCPKCGGKMKEEK